MRGLSQSQRGFALLVPRHGPLRRTRMRGLSQYQFFFRAFCFVVIVMVALGTY